LKYRSRIILLILIALFKQSVPIIFSARDDDFHATRRKALSPAFSLRALRDFEINMSVDILNLKHAIGKEIEDGGPFTLDFAPWGEKLASQGC
jgi:hypothetical protein